MRADRAGVRGGEARRRAAHTGSAESGGFTMVELLVVVAVIALLLGILVPALGAARVRAGVIKDLCNLRQLGLVSTSVASQRHDELFRSSHSYFAHRASGAQPWFRDVYEHLTEESYTGPKSCGWSGVLDEHLRNPLDPRRAPAFRTPFEPEYNGSYALNVYVELTREETPDGRVWRRLSRIPSPSDTVLFGEVSEGASGTMARDHVMAHFWLNAVAPPGSEIAIDRNRPGCGYLCFDGHAANLRFQTTFSETSGIDQWNPAP